MRPATTLQRAFCTENVTIASLTQGLELYGVLKSKGVSARLVYFPDENHWILKPQNSQVWYQEVHDWLARWLTQ